MKLKLKSARRHPLEGLEVTGEDGVAYLTHTKRSVLEAGAVMFLQNYPDPCPQKRIQQKCHTSPAGQPRQ